MQGSKGERSVDKELKQKFECKKEPRERMKTNLVQLNALK